MIGPDARAQLLEIAKQAVVATVTGAAHQPATLADDLAKGAAAFVSLHVGGQLRGCIGHLDEDRPLARTVAHCARLACTEDPRFPAVSADEIHQLDVEISVLGGFERVSSLTDVVVGRHGLLVEHDGRRGLLLPQVATEYQWNAETFVEQTCRKAGLPRDAWSKTGAVLYRFEAEVFGRR
jgi:AmmeMemoRadiSam system protein A